MKKAILVLCAMFLPAPVLAAEAVNPYLHNYAPETITVAVTEGAPSKQVIQAKGVNRRSQYTEGYMADGTYSITTPAYEYSVIPSAQKVMRFVPPAKLFSDFYSALNEAQKAVVTKNIAKLGTNVEYFADTLVTPAKGTTIMGRDAECFDYASKVPDANPATKCYWQGIVLWSAHYGLTGAATVEAAVEIKPGALDDALFAIPAGYAVEDSTTDAIMKEKYSRIFQRMLSPDFGLKDLNAY